MEKTEEPAILFGKSKWIWSNEVFGKDSDVIFRRIVSFVDKPPSRALCRAACDTQYYLFVNDNAVVWQGGFARSVNAYYDEFDISKYLSKGDNVIVVYARYFGNGGRDLVPSGRAGFIFECPDLNIFSDGTFSAYENPAYVTPHANNSYCAGRDILYDASREGQIQNHRDPAFRSSLFQPAKELDAYPDGYIGALLPRPLPMYRFSAQPVIGKYKKSCDQFHGDTYTITLPKMSRVTPYMEVTGNGQEKIEIFTDRSNCGGTFGDENSVYRAHTIEYITKPTLNVFEGLLPMTGEKLIFSMPRTVKVLKLGYRELGYATDPNCFVKTDSDRLNTLFDKAKNTLYACLGSTIMDTPERERTMWLGDSSIAARALYLSYDGAGKIVRKVIDDILATADGDVLLSCVPGNVPVDIPAHGLLALSEYGLFAQYRNFENSRELFDGAYGKLCEYLMLWDMTEHGVALRDGNRRWYDNLYNIDEPLVENALYYSACKFMRDVGREIGDSEYDETFEDRMENIADYIESCWNGLGYSSQGDALDDRANALIVLAELVPDERKESVARLLSAVQNASPYMEWAVIEALCKLDKRDAALSRFTSRYAVAAEDGCSTLGEDFGGYGTKCQSYQAQVITEIISLFGGIDVKNGAREISIAPDFGIFEDFRCSITLATGELEVRYKSGSKIEIIIDNRTSGKVTLDVAPERMLRPTERRTILLNKGKNKFAI